MSVTQMCDANPIEGQLHQTIMHVQFDTETNTIGYSYTKLKI